MSRHLFVGLPSYTGVTWVPTWIGLFYGLWQLHDWRVELYPVLFEAEIANTRSRIAMEFLRQSQASDLLFVDWDMVFDASAVQRILSHPVDLVAGDYPKRSDKSISYSADLMRVDGHWNTERTATGLIEVEHVPAGFLRVSRTMVQRMVEAYPDLECNDVLLDDNKGCALFQPLIENGLRWSEDKSFCRRWRAIGGQVYVDPEIKICHWGHKQFVGDYQQWLKQAAAIPQ